MKVGCYYCESLLGVGNSTFTFKCGKQSIGPEKRFFKVCFFLSRHLDTQILEFFPLLLTWSYYFFPVFGHIMYGLLAYLEIWASDFLFHCLHSCHTMEEGADFCSILHSNSASPEGPLSASFCFMELHTLTLSWIVSWLSIELALFTPEGQEPCFVPSIQLWGWQVAGICHSTNTWLIKWITKGPGCSPWVSASVISAGSIFGICIIEIWSFTCAKPLPTLCIHLINKPLLSISQVPAIGWNPGIMKIVPAFKKLVIKRENRSPDDSVVMKSCNDGWMGKVRGNQKDGLAENMWVSQTC